MSSEKNAVVTGEAVVTEAKPSIETPVVEVAPKSSAEPTSSEPKSNEEEDEKDEADDEENLLATIEKEKEKEAAEEASRPKPLPTDIESAPKLLRDALKAAAAAKLADPVGAVLDAINGHKKSADSSAEKTGNDSNEEKKNEDGDAKASDAPSEPAAKVSLTLHVGFNKFSACILGICDLIFEKVKEVLSLKAGNLNLHSAIF